MSRPMRIGVIVALFTSTAVSSLRVPLLPEIGAELQLTAAELGVTTAVFGLGRIVTNIPAGRISDRISPAISGMFASVLMAAGTVVIAVAPAFWALMIGVGIAGSASAMMNTTAMTSLTRSADRSRRGAAMATYSTSLMTGQIVGPAIAGIAAAVFSWRITHGIGAGIAAALALALLLIWIQDGRQLRAAEPARPAVAKASTSAAADEGPDMRPIQLAAVAGVSFAVFFTLSALPQTVMPLIGSLELGIPVELIGLAIGSSAIARIVGARIAGRIADRVSRRAALIPSLVLLGLSPLLMLAPLSWGGWLAALLLLSLASSGAAIAGTVIGDLSRPGRLGARMGVYRTLGDIGLLIGGLASGLAYELGGRIPTVLLVVAVCAIATVLAFIMLPREGAGRER